MKITFNISEIVFQKFKKESLKQGKTMSELVEAALWTLFQYNSKPSKRPPFPEFDSCEARVNVADRETLYNVMVL